MELLPGVKPVLRGRRCSVAVRELPPGLKPVLRSRGRGSNTQERCYSRLAGDRGGNLDSLTSHSRLLGFSAQYYSDWMHKNAEQVQAALAEANSQATEVVGAIRTVASFGNERGEWARYSRKIMDYYRLNVRQTAISGVYYMLCCTFLMNTVVQAALLIFGAYYVLYDGMPPELLLAFMLYQGQLQEYFQNLLNSFTNLIKSSGAGTKVWSVLGLHWRAA